MRPVRAAIVDADAGFREEIADTLKEAGHKVFPYPSPGRFLDSLAGEAPGLVVLALEMPGLSGWEVIRILRSLEATRHALIVAISDHAPDSRQVVHAFQLGADEFLQKPLEAEVFLARLNAMLRRSPGTGTSSIAEMEEVLESGPLRIDLPGRTVALAGETVKLTPLEFDLLSYLLRGKGRVMTRSLILQEVWKTEPDLNTRTVDKCVERLRKRLPGWGSRIETISGIGYCLRD